MASDGKKPKIIPSPLNPNRTIVIIVVIVIVAILAIVVGLTLTSHNAPQSNRTSSTPSINGIRLDSYTYQRNASTGATIFNVTLSNLDNTNGSAVVDITLSQNPDAPPNQPYSGRQPAPSNPTFTATQNITLAAGETKTVPIEVATPSWFGVQSSSITVTLG